VKITLQFHVCVEKFPSTFFVWMDDKWLRIWEKTECRISAW
jgi:hypothetical protein